jgi:hypothetical protein
MNFRNKWLNFYPIPYLIIYTKTQIGLRLEISYILIIIIISLLCNIILPKPLIIF